MALARAIVFGPRVLLMDEPLGALDKKLREPLQLEIMRIHRELGRTFVYVTHDQEEALVMSDRIAIFNGGRIEQAGTSAELYERPDSLFVAEFIGESNILRGDVAEDAGEVWLQCDFGRVRLGRARAVPRGPASVLVRPERVSLLGADKAGDAGRNEVRGVVSDLIYLGNTRKYGVRVDGGRASWPGSPSPTPRPSLRWATASR